MKQTSAIGFVKLHRIHAAQTATRVEFADAGGMTWRGEGGNGALKEAMAHRIAMCWNVLEGIPTERLGAGFVRDLIAAVQDGDLTRAQSLAASSVDAVELVDGRPSDCAACVKAGVYDESEAS